MVSSRVANQRQWDSHMTHMRTNNMCSSLTSALPKGAATRCSGLAGPHTEHALPAILTAKSCSQTSKWPEYFWLVQTFSVHFIVNALATVVTATHRRWQSPSRHRRLQEHPLQVRVVTSKSLPPHTYTPYICRAVGDPSQE